MDKTNELISFFSMEKFLSSRPFLVALNINDYPILMFFWNLFLLAIPFFLFIFLKRYWQKNKFQRFFQKSFAVFLFFLWFIFAPNSIYTITAIRHLLDFCPREAYLRICAENAWMIMFFFLYALLGWVFFVVYLNQMKNLVMEIFSKKAGKIFIGASIPFMSLGVLLGLVDRLNSWDVFFFNAGLLKIALKYLTDFYYIRNFIVFTAGLYILYFAGNFLFKDSLYGLFKNRKSD